MWKRLFLLSCVFCLSLIPEGAVTSATLPAYIVHPHASLGQGSRQHCWVGRAQAPQRNNKLVSTWTSRPALEPGARRAYLRSPRSAIFCVRAQAGVGASVAPVLDDREMLYVDLVGLGPSEWEGTEATFFVGPRAELLLGDEDRGWGELKSFPKALPLPVASREDKAILMSVHGLGSEDESAYKLGALAMAQTLAAARDVYSGLPFKSPVMRDAVSSVTQGKEGIIYRRVEAIASVASLSACHLERLVFDEVESWSDDALVLGCYLVFRPKSGQGMRADVEMRTWVPVAAGAALSAHLSLPMLLPKHIWREAACRVDVATSQQLGSRDLGSRNLGPHGRFQDMRVHSAQPAAWRTPTTPNQLAARAQSMAERQQTASTPEGLEGVSAWQLRAGDALTLPDGALRGLLRSYGVACKRGQSRRELLEKLMPLMDEVERRAVRIQLAVEEEDYEAARAAQALMSDRANTSERIQKAVQDEQFYEAAALQERLEVQTMSTADVTAEQGSYDRFLDADDWYTEQILRSKKRKQQRERGE